jgi:lipopolysaccharide transport system ATP-binding protein
MTVNFEVQLPEALSGMALSLQLFNHLNQAITYNWFFDEIDAVPRKNGTHNLSIKFDKIKLYQGNYFVRVHLAETVTKTKFQQFDCCPFEVAMLNKKAPEWGWQNNVCHYIEDGNWTS